MKNILKNVIKFNKKAITFVLTLTMVLSVMLTATAKEVFARDSEGHWTTSDYNSGNWASNIQPSMPTNDELKNWPTEIPGNVSDDVCNKNTAHVWVSNYGYTRSDNARLVYAVYFPIVYNNNTAGRVIAIVTKDGSDFYDHDKSYQAPSGWYVFNSSYNKYVPCSHISHTHSFAYTVSSNTITAKCSSTCTNDTYKTGITVSLSAPAQDNLTYNGSAKEVTKNVSTNFENITGSTIDNTTYYLSDGITKTTSANSGAASDGGAPKNVGSYVAKVTVTKSGATGSPATASVNFTIAKADSSASPSAKTLTYTGSPQELVNSGTVSGGTIKFSTSENGDYSTTIPSGTNAGDYTVWYKVDGDKNHNDKNATQISNVKINKADVTLSGVTASEKTYDGTTDATLTSNGSLSGILNGDDLSYTVTGAFADKNVGPNKDVNLTVTLTGAAENNYKKSSTSQTKTSASILKKDITTTITPNGGYYGNVTAATAVLNNTVTGNNISPVVTYTGTSNEGTHYNNTVTPTKAGTYTITVTLGGTDASNYNLLNNDNNPTTGTFNIAKAKVDIPEKDNAEFTFNKQEQTYSLTENADIYTITDNNKTNAGTYNVKVELKDKNNYEWNDSTATTDVEKIADKNYTFIINPLSIESNLITLTIPETSFILTSEQLTNVGSKSLDIALKYGDTVLNSNDFKVTDGTKDAFGKYKAVLEGKGNYTGKLERDWSITQTKQEPVPVDLTEVDPETTYNGKLTVKVTGEENTPVATINNPLVLLNILEKDCLKTGANDADIILTLISKVKGDINPDSKVEIEKISKGTDKIRFLDITLEKVLKTIEADSSVSNSVTIPITECEEPIEITIDIPKDIPTVKAGYTRKYTIIRSHLTEVEGEEPSYVAEALVTKYKDGKVSFMTDKFSDYALMYVDTPIPRHYKTPDTSVR